MNKKIRQWAGLTGLVLLVFSLIAFNSREPEFTPVTIGEEEATFLRDMADARIMDMEEGKLARSRGTTREIKNYGRWMIKDQAILMKELQTLAASKGITLSKKLSEKKSEGLADLKKEQGEEFDKKFIRMITIDHKRDVREFKKATEFADKDIREFAGKYLPAIESHLDRIKEIKKED